MSREAFEAWIRAKGYDRKYAGGWNTARWEAWQAAERETARKCYDVIAGQGAIGGQREAYADAIKKEFPEAFE